MIYFAGRVTFEGRGINVLLNFVKLRMAKIITKATRLLVIKSVVVRERAQTIS